MRDSRVLVIAYGNRLRGDDGLAWRAAEELLRTCASCNPEILQRHQLVPELAERIAAASAVIFVDASAPSSNHAPGEVRIREINGEEKEGASQSPFHHQLSPASLLALAHQLYGVRPRALVASVAGYDFGPGERISPAVERAIPELVARLEELIREITLSAALRPKSGTKT